MNERFLKSMSRLRPHGTRARYQQGCHCFSCRLAVSRYAAELKARHKAGEPLNGYVSVEAVVAHLKSLSRAGIGLGTVSEITGLAKGNLSMIRLGKCKYVRANKERLILSVTAQARINGTLVSKSKVRSMVKHLQREGFTLRQISARANVSRGVFRKQGRVMACTEMKIEKFYNRIMAA